MLERQKMTKNNEKMTKEGEGCIFILLPLSWTLITFIVMNISIYYVNMVLCQDLAQNKMRSSATKLLTENRPSHTFFRSR